jgi:hypothetical protein
MTIEKLYFHQLPEDVKEDMPNNGCDKEDASYIHIEWDDGTHSYYSDAMEPEDARFSRDLFWIISVLKEMYQEGINKGKAIERALQDATTIAELAEMNKEKTKRILRLLNEEEV